MHQYDGPERRTNPELMDVKISMLHQDVSEMKTVLRELTSAITRLALVEERIATASAAQERAFAAIDKIEGRITKIEQKMPEYSRVSIWVDRGIWAAAAAAVLYVAKKVGLM